MCDVSEVEAGESTQGEQLVTEDAEDDSSDHFSRHDLGMDEVVRRRVRHLLH